MSQQGSFQNSNAVVDLNAVAMQALVALLANPQVLPARATLPSDHRIQRQLAMATISKDRDVMDKVVLELIARGVSHKDLANDHVPAVARKLGKDWADGTLSFADVSIGCVRLQGYLRQMGLDWCDIASMSRPVAGQVLLVVPEYEQHTLGATLLAGQLRAQGVEVKLAYHATTAAIIDNASKHDYDAILISSSQSETLALLRKTVVRLSRVNTNTPIILGGSVTTQVKDARLKSGADFIANSWQDAMKRLPDTKSPSIYHARSDA